MGPVAKLMTRRVPVPTPGADLVGIEKLELVDITILVGSGREVTEIEKLGLRFDASGMSVRRWDGSPVVQIPWVSIQKLEPSERTPKKGSPRVELLVSSDRKQHRFVVPYVSADVLRGSLEAMCARYARAGIVSDGRKGLRLH